jgi:hypothetical protein
MKIATIPVDHPANISQLAKPAKGKMRLYKKNINN